MLLPMLGALFVCLFIVWRRHRKGVGKDAVGPLAGYDTGVRSAYRTPARLFKNRRTL